MNLLSDIQHGPFFYTNDTIKASTKVQLNEAHSWINILSDVSYWCVWMDVRQQFQDLVQVQLDVHTG